MRNTDQIKHQRRKQLAIRNRQMRATYSSLKKKKLADDYILSVIKGQFGLSNEVYIWQILSEKDAISKADTGEKMDKMVQKQLDKHANQYKLF